LKDYLWFCDNRVQAAVLDKKASNRSNESSPSEVVGYMRRWDDFVDARASSASVFANRPYQTSKDWPRAEGEIALVSSTALTVGLSAVLTFIAVVVCTWDPVLALQVLSMILVTVLGVMFFMVAVFQWDVGAIEMTSLIIFMGYAVPYSLHVAHLYNNAAKDDEELLEARERRYLDQSQAGAVAGEAARAEGGGEGQPEPTEAELRALRTRLAIVRVGRAIWGSAVLTVGCSFFFLFGAMLIFAKLAALLIVETVLSVCAAFICLPAILMVMGPKVDPVYNRPVRSAWRRFAEHFVSGRYLLQDHGPQDEESDRAGSGWQDAGDRVPEGLALPMDDSGAEESTVAASTDQKKPGRRWSADRQRRQGEAAQASESSSPQEDAGQKEDPRELR
jgi:hypothetical protein